MAPGSKYDGTSEVFNDASSAGVSSPSVTAPYSQDGMVGRSSDKIFVADERSNNLPIPVAHEDLAHGNDIELHQHKDTGAVAVAGTDTGITQQTGTYTACYPEAYGHVAPSSVTSTAYEAYSTKILHGVNNGVEGGVVERGVQGDEKRKGAGCCGLSRKASWLIGIGVLVLLIAAIAGGVAGGLASQRSQQDGAAEGADEGEGQDSPSTPQRNASWVDTQIAAVNFTDSANATRRALFYQREQGSIWMSLSPTVKGGSDDDGEAWTQFDVGSALTAARNKDGYSPPKNGTPLAAAAIPPGEADFLGYKFAVGLYYLDEDDMVREVLTYDSERLEAWVVGGLQRQPAQASAGSQLAATPHFCADGCANAICVAHQESSGELSVACGNAWDQPWELDAAYPGTSLAMVPFASDNGKNITKANWMRLFWQRDNAIQVYADNDGSWGIGSDAALTDQNPVNAVLPKVVAVPSQAQSHMMVIGMTADGVFTGSQYRPVPAWDFDRSIQFVNEGGDTTENRPKDLNLKNIAMDHNGGFFGLADDLTRVIQYTWDTENPFELRWEREIGI